MISLELRCSLRQGMELSGGLTSQSVLIRTEEKLLDTRYQEALEYAGKRKRMERYRSMMDFLFCESFTEWRWHAYRYYNGEGPQLINHPLLTDEMLKAYDAVLCDLVLEICLVMLDEKSMASWDDAMDYTRKFMQNSA